MSAIGRLVLVKAVFRVIVVTKTLSKPLCLVGRASIALFMASAMAMPFVEKSKADDSSMQLRGEAFIAGATIVDPPPDEPQGTHAYLIVTGEAASKIFDALKSVPTEDVCRGEGWMIKSAGDFSCATNCTSGEAECDFSIDLRSGTTAAGRPC